MMDFLGLRRENGFELSYGAKVRFCLGAGRKANILGSVHETEKIVR